MKINIIILGIIVAGQLACSDDSVDINAFRDDKSVTTLNGTWKVVSFEDYATRMVEQQTQENSWNTDIIVTFDDTVDPKLLSGKVTTNSVAAEFEYVGLRKFKVSKYGSTYVAQPPWADKFGQAVLDENTSFKINQDQLRIYYDNESKSITLTRKR